MLIWMRLMKAGVLVNKRCSDCQELKSIEQFQISCRCKECIKIRSKTWASSNRARKNADKERFMLKHPWYGHLSWARQRCNNPRKHNYSAYGGRGIKCFLTQEDIKILWFRDKAFLLKHPSLDRKDADGNYCLSNCRFIEHGQNRRRKNKEEED